MDQELNDKSLNNSVEKFNVSEILKDTSITEVIFQPDGHLCYEKEGLLYSAHRDTLFQSASDLNREQLFSEIMESLPKAPSYDFPLANGIWRDFRVQIVSPPAIQETMMIQLRRISSLETFNSFDPEKWNLSNEVGELLLDQFYKKKKNFMILGPTGCGKTTLLKSLLNEFGKKDRVICIEDTPELPKVNDLSCNLNTYNSSSDEIQDVTLKDLVKASLRLRPDRLVMGEMRGEEAAVFLLMLSTGHRGSGATIHAHNPQDALRRLEMLVQMGSPWNLHTVRSLIFNSLDLLITMGKDEKGNRTILKVSEIECLEEQGFLVNHLYENYQALEEDQ